MGINNVAALQGGWQAWQMAAYPVEGSTSPGVIGTPAAASALTEGSVAVLGSADAPVTIIELSDLQCPYCSRYALLTFPKIKETYIDTGQVRYVVYDFPLSIHRHAVVAAEAARCAGEQDEYWRMRNGLFATQAEWGREMDPAPMFVGYAGDLGLDAGAFRACLESGRYADAVTQSAAAAREAGLSGTPSLFINDRFLYGAYPFEDMQRLIEAELAEAK